MFTGIVETVGSILKADHQDETGGTSYTIDVPADSDLLSDCHLGDSIAVNGVCLTVTAFTLKPTACFTVGVAPETLRVTDLGALKEGSYVNLERAVRADTRMGGHFVQGHVDCTAEIIDKRPDGNAVTFRFRPIKQDLLRYIVYKGFIAIDGTSLTVTTVNDEECWWEVMLIAYTQERVVVAKKEIGETVNIELPTYPIDKPKAALVINKPPVNLIRTKQPTTSKPNKQPRMATEVLNETTFNTLEALEARLLRMEQVLYGHPASQQPSASNSGDEPAAKRIQDLERRLNGIVSRVRVYGELLRIQKSYPSLFYADTPSDLPTQLSTAEISAVVLSAASSFPATSSALSAIKDTPIPDPAQTAALIAQTDRMRALEAVQAVQAAEIAELRTRSEKVVRAWYQGGLLDGSARLADVQARAERAEGRVRRAERAKDDEKVL
ncbi:hypothetical protein TD95_003928 [Thielaviopsis punctulata]|uniref:Riboflavin synthase n=1 Tax=Thielaviopsis punctulata TaxID=72032 RepID=A0A0F4ZCH3_9PEZI|nr:hypothetical protein TD95_003928 [Thielaviopsis punctulata]